MECLRISGEAAIQGSSEWKELRGKFRTASEAAIVLGESPFQKPEDLKLIKAGLKTVFYSAAMKQGNDRENEVRKKAEELFDDVFEPQVWTRGSYLASLDGINMEGDTLVELKVSEKTYNELLGKQISKHYHLQILQQMYCSGAVNGYLVAMNPKTGEVASSLRISYEDKFIDEVEKAWNEFDEMPIPEIKEVIDFSKDDEFCNLSLKYQAYKNDMDILKDNIEECKIKMIMLADGKNAVCDDLKVSFKKGAKRTDTKSALARYAPDVDLSDFISYGKPTWAITVK